jgi:hypothetical protein
MDRMPEELFAQLVKPLDAALREEGLGRVVEQHIREMLSVDVRLNVRGMAGFERLLHFLVENSAPIGTVAYCLNWLGQKKDIVVLGPQYD